MNSADERCLRFLGPDQPWAEEVFRAAMEVFARDGWDDPLMDAYDALDPRQHPASNNP